MAGITSTISDSGRVYLFDRNALPKNFIEQGMKVISSGLTATVQPGTCDISGKFHEIIDPMSIAIPQRTAALIYAKKSDIVDTPTLGYIPAALPPVDANMIVSYIMDGSATITNRAVGNGLAVANNLVSSGTITPVDGMFGNTAAKGDGSTGNYQMTNTTGFPTGTQTVGVCALYTAVGSYPSNVYIFHNGTSADANMLTLWINTSGVICFGAGTYSVASGFTVESGKTYWIECYANAGIFYFYVNGYLVATSTTSLNITNTMGYIGKGYGSAGYFTGTLHYVEIRNAIRTPSQIAAISNALLLPCRYILNYLAEATNIGTMTSIGGLSACWDGNTNKDQTTGAQTTGVVSYAQSGKSFVTPVLVRSAVVYGNTRYGFYNDSTVNGVLTTITLRGSADGNAWTDVASVTVPNTGTQWSSGQPIATINNPNSIQYKFWTIKIQRADSGADTYYNIAQIQFTVVNDGISTDIRTTMPTDSIVIGFIRTDTGKAVEEDYSSYKYGRREGAVGGNRRVPLEWKAFNGATQLYWNNPFDTQFIRMDFFGRSTSSQGFQTPVPSLRSDSVGCQTRQDKARPINLQIASGGAWADTSGAWVTSGYIGGYVEVIE